MRTLSTFCLFLAPFAFSMAGCSSQSDIRSQIGNGNEGPPRAVSENDSFFIEVRGDEYGRGDHNSDLESTNVFVEIGPDHAVYSKRFILTWGEEIIPKMEIKTIDRKEISEVDYQAIRRNLSHYLLSANTETDEVLTPKDCPIPLDSVSQAFVGTGTNYREADTSFVFPSECMTQSGAVVRNDLNAILESLPQLEGLGGYRID